MGGGPSFVQNSFLGGWFGNSFSSANFYYCRVRDWYMALAMWSVPYFFCWPSIRVTASPTRPRGGFVPSSGEMALAAHKAV